MEKPTDYNCTSKNEYRPSPKHISDHHFSLHSLTTGVSATSRQDYLYYYLVF